MSLQPFFYANGHLSIRGRLATVFFVLVLLTATAVGVNYYSFSKLESSIQNYRVDVVQRQTMLTDIRNQLGYGGAIHHFKNFVLRGETRYLSAAKSGFKNALSTIEHYHDLELTAEESKALVLLTGVIRQYQSQLTDLYREGYDSSLISMTDEKVKVDDEPAIRAINLLYDEMNNMRRNASANNDVLMNNSIDLTLIGGTLIFLACLIGLAWVYRSVLKRISSFAAYSRELHDGNIRSADTSNWDELSEIADNYSAVIEELSIEKDKAESSAKAKSAFLATVSHEIRTPMNGVLGVAQLLEKSQLNSEQRSQLRSLYESGEHMMVLLNEILDYSKIEEGKLELDKVPFAMSSVVGFIQSMYYSIAKDKGLELHINSSIASNRWYKGDRSRLRQIIFNLLNNAIKFTDRGYIEISFDESQQGDRLRLDIGVKDTGIGMSEEVQQRIFTPFEQADSSTTRNYGGTGLGLSIVKRLAELMHGQVSVNSQEGMGSYFKVSVYLDETEPVEDSVVQTKRLSYEGLKALIVEDNRVNTLVIESMLKQKGFEVAKAGNGREGVQLASQESFNLILMDNHMPLMDGLQAMPLIRQQEHNKDVVMLGCTADVFQESRTKMLQAGADELVAKPIVERELDEMLGVFAKRLFSGAVVFKSNFQLNNPQPTFNVEETLRNIGLPMHMAENFFSTVIEETQAHLAMLAQGVQLNEQDKVKHYTHTVKATWRNLAAWHLVSMAENIELQILQQEHIDTVLIERFIEQSELLLSEIAAKTRVLAVS
ncbi:ATP-binding protein [Vibrio maerlii]|uniref:ATP-binding protein n=1 Tax=Vibrio maerlii TaxID=2231648 RepID=UPI000E3E2D38|nr:ATP-binding protein [Vibrio maerlii]